MSKAWVMQNKVTAVQCQWLITGDSDNNTTAPETTSNAASNTSKKHVINFGVAVVAHAQALPSKRLRKAPISSNSKKGRDKEPMDVQTTSRYGGLEDEDDMKEWEALE